MKNSDIVFSMESLLDKVWDMDYEGGTRTVDIQSISTKFFNSQYEAPFGVYSTLVS